MRLFQAFLGLSIVASGFSSYDVWSPVTCKEGEATSLGDCKAEFQRCRCERWITSRCPETAVFDANTKLCIFNHECLAPPTTSTSAPTFTPTPAPQNPTEAVTTGAYTTIGGTLVPTYTSTPVPQNPTVTYTTTAAPIYPTSGPQYPEIVTTGTYSTIGVTSAPTFTPAPQNPTEAVPVGTYATIGITSAPQNPTEAVPVGTYNTIVGTQGTSADAPQNGYGINTAQTGYGGQMAPVYGTYHPQGLSNSFYVPRRFNRHRHHRGRYWGDDEYLNWDVFPRSRVHPVLRKKHRHHRKDDDDESVPATDFALGGVEDSELHDAEEEKILESSGIAPEETETLTNDAEAETSNSKPVTRKKRSTHYVSQDLPSTKCLGAADNSIFSLGFCVPNFIVCKSSQDTLAGCPDGDLFDFVKSRCVPASVCGKGNVDICMVPTPAPQNPTVTPTTNVYYTETPATPTAAPIYPTSGPQYPETASTGTYYTIGGRLVPTYTSTPVPQNPAVTYTTTTAPIYPTSGPQYPEAVTMGTYATIGITPAPQNPTEAVPIGTYATIGVTSAPTFTPVPQNPAVTYTTTAAPIYPTPGPQYPEAVTMGTYATIGITPAPQNPTEAVPIGTYATIGVTSAPQNPTEAVPVGTYATIGATQYTHRQAYTTEAYTNTYAPKNVDKNISYVATVAPQNPVEVTTETYATSGPIPSQAPPMEYYGQLDEPKYVYITVSSNYSEFCDKRRDSLYRDPKSCSSIIQCYNGEMFQHVGCPSGLVFNEDIQQCDYRGNVPECDQTEHDSAANNQCNGKSHGAYIADDTNCNIFYRCVWDRLVQMNCPAGTVFNPTLSVCDWPVNVPKCSTPAADEQIPY